MSELLTQNHDAIYWLGILVLSVVAFIMVVFLLIACLIVVVYVYNRTLLQVYQVVCALCGKYDKMDVKIAERYLYSGAWGSRLASRIVLMRRKKND